jgi:hypothetical protein
MRGFNMPNKKIILVLGTFLGFSSNVLIAENSRAASSGDEEVRKKSLIPISLPRMSDPNPYLFPEVPEDPVRRKISREELLAKAFRRASNSVAVVGPVKWGRDDDERPIASDLGSFFSQYSRGDE